MPTIHPGDLVSLYPDTDLLAAGMPLIIPKLDCKSLGAMTTSGAFKGFPPRAADRDNVVAAMEGLVIPEPFHSNQWGKPGFPMVAQLQRQTCLWLNHAAVQFDVTIDLEESRSPTDFVDAPEKVTHVPWSANTTYHQAVTSDTPPSTFAFLGGGDPWTVDLLVEAVDTGCDVAIHLVATMHAPSGFDFTVSGRPDVQEDRKSCAEFTHGAASFFAWLGVRFNPGDPVGLVKSLGLTVRGTAIYT